MLLPPSPILSGLFWLFFFFLHTTIWQAKHISKLPFWNKGSRNQESSCAFPARRREKTAFAGPSSFPKPLLNARPLAGCSTQEPSPRTPTPEQGGGKIPSSASFPGMTLLPGAANANQAARLPPSAPQVPLQKIRDSFYLATSCLSPFSLFKRKTSARNWRCPTQLPCARSRTPSGVRRRGIPPQLVPPPSTPFTTVS